MNEGKEKKLFICIADLNVNSGLYQNFLTKMIIFFLLNYIYLIKVGIPFCDYKFFIYFIYLYYFKELVSSKKVYYFDKLNILFSNKYFNW